MQCFFLEMFFKKVLDNEWKGWYYNARGLKDHAMSRGSDDQRMWWHPACDPLAQLAEHLTFNQGVRSSNLRWVTIAFKLSAGVVEWQTRQT